MKNYLEAGSTVVVTAPEDVSSGEFIKVGSLYGVAPVAASSGAAVVLNRSGVYELPKVDDAAWTQGQKLYWDAGAKKFTTDASKTPVAAVAFAAALLADTEGQVLLGAGSEIRIVAGLHTTVTATDTIVTGLSKVLGAIASYETDVADPNTYVQAAVGDQAGAPAAGSIIVKSWKTTGSDPTPVAADAFAKKVSWLAFGY